MVMVTVGDETESDEDGDATMMPTVVDAIETPTTGDDIERVTSGESRAVMWRHGESTGGAAGVARWWSSSSMHYLSPMKSFRESRLLTVALSVLLRSRARTSNSPMPSRPVTPPTVAVA